MDYYEYVKSSFSKLCYLLEFNNEEEWLKMRMNGIGGSDLGPILGHSQWKNRKDIYKSKKVPQEQISNYAIEFGNYFEDIMFNIFKFKFRDVYKVLNFKNIMFKNKWLPFLQASLDGVLVDTKNRIGILEIKTAQERKGKWYDRYNNRIVPQTYFDQAIHYFNVTNAEYVVFFVAINYEKSQNDRCFEILQPRVFWRKDYQNYCNNAIKECSIFWNDYVVKNIEPKERIVC